MNNKKPHLKLSRKKIKSIESLYNSGLSQREVGKLFSVSYSTIDRVMRKHNIPVRSSGPIKRIHLDIDQITKLRNSGSTLKEIGVLFKASHTTIFNFIIKNNI
ncbi:Transposase IS30-like HTH domain containing protein [uncultured Caudovirales phage]|jgi:DNA invertase Pin-like site-specific DNA recombinase|uniref:Transposase IS30-like HTH domain containing protein n=1 Tax=uncultured Caudovirales phage TaxID=2100421 RepID=A0A6J5S073_9CAUD|nr:Transposase IS30-like HTH domain containing protein [uncultured Caudovirales phage]